MSKYFLFLFLSIAASPAFSSSDCSLPLLPGRAQHLVIVHMQNGATESRYHGSRLKSDAQWQNRYHEIISKISTIVKEMQFETITFLLQTGFRRPDFNEVIPQLLPFTRTFPVLGYPKDDGTPELLAYHKNTWGPEDIIYLCGMNTDACVFTNALGLKNQGLQPVILKDLSWTVYAATKNAFHDAFGIGHWVGLRRARRNGIPTVFSTKAFKKSY